MTDIIIGKELLIDVIATLQENSVAAKKVKKDLADIDQLTSFREMELDTIIEGSEAAINDIENS